MIEACEFTKPGNSLVIKVELVEVQCLYILIKYAPVFRVEKSALFSGLRVWPVLNMRIADGSA